jgi:hypothetical protein
MRRAYVAAGYEQAVRQRLTTSACAPEQLLPRKVVTNNTDTPMEPVVSDHFPRWCGQRFAGDQG